MSPRKRLLGEHLTFQSTDQRVIFRGTVLRNSSLEIICHGNISDSSIQYIGFDKCERIHDRCTVSTVSYKL